MRSKRRKMLLLPLPIAVAAAITAAGERTEINCCWILEHKILTLPLFRFSEKVRGNRERKGERERRKKRKIERGIVRKKEGVRERIGRGSQEGSKRGKFSLLLKRR